MGHSTALPRPGCFKGWAFRAAKNWERGNIWGYCAHDIEEWTAVQ